MTQLTKEDLKQVLKEVGVVTKDNFGQTLKDYGVVTKQDLKVMGMVTKSDLKEMGIVTKQDLKVMGIVTEKVLKRELNKTKKELIGRISNIALSSPTINQFNELEKRVSSFEAFAN